MPRNLDSYIRGLDERLIKATCRQFGNAANVQPAFLVLWQMLCGSKDAPPPISDIRCGLDHPDSRYLTLYFRITMGGLTFDCAQPYAFVRNRKSDFNDDQKAMVEYLNNNYLAHYGDKTWTFNYHAWGVEEPLCFIEKAVADIKWSDIEVLRADGCYEFLLAYQGATMKLGGLSEALQRTSIGGKDYVLITRHWYSDSSPEEHIASFDAKNRDVIRINRLVFYLRGHFDGPESHMDAFFRCIRDSDIFDFLAFCEVKRDCEANARNLARWSLYNNAFAARIAANHAAGRI